MDLSEAWFEKFSEIELPSNKDSEIFVGFNTDVDIITHLSRKNLENYMEKLDSEKIREKMQDPPSFIREEEDFIASFLSSLNRGESNEVDIERKKSAEKIRDFFDFGESDIGGQAGISANFLSELASVILYTPFVSEKQREYLSEKILYPVIDDNGLVLKNVKDVENTEDTKVNMIFEYEKGMEIPFFDVEAPDSGRFILSDFIPGYEPLLPRSIEEKIPLLFEDVDRVFISGYQDLRGKNFHSRLFKARNQLKKIKGSKPGIRIHLEFVSERDRRLELEILDQVAREVHSIGCDRYELEQILSLLGYRELVEDLLENDFSLGSAFNAAKEIMKTLNVERFHLHTNKYLFTLVKSDYRENIEKIRDSLLFGGYSAVVKASIAKIPNKDDLDGQYPSHVSLEGLSEIEDFAEYMGLEESFTREGIKKFKEWNLAVVPALIAEDCKELVGLGDIISSGSFLAETW